MEYTAASLKKSLAAVDEFARVEGLEGHGASARIRFEP
jgi:histidinol dehydrogenase